MAMKSVAYTGPGELRLDVAVDGFGDRRQPLAEREARAQRRLDVGHQQRGADPLAGHVADQQRDEARVELEVVEEVAADFARRHRDALHFRQAEVQRRARLHVRLDLAAQLELAADPLLFDRRALVLLDVGGHAVERRRQPADLVARFHRHARAVVPLRDAADAAGEIA